MKSIEIHYFTREIHSKLFTIKNSLEIILILFISVTNDYTDNNIVNTKSIYTIGMHSKLF